MTKAEWTAWLTASGWLGAPGATEAELSALEARLGVRLPPSYRSFLEASNGFLMPGVIVPRVLRADEVAWYRDTHAETIDAFNQGLTDFGGVREAFLDDAIQISAVELVGSAVYLLTPRAVSPDGEWEAGYFADWVPGVHKYPSFQALMFGERQNSADR